MKGPKTALLGVGAAVTCGLVILGAILGVRAASSAVVTTRPATQAPASSHLEPSTAASTSAAGSVSKVIFQ